MMKLYPTQEQFEKLTAEANTVPVYCQLLSDHHTPVSAFEQLSPHSEYCFLLESVVGGERIAQYSFIGINPAAVFTAYGRQVTIADRRGRRRFSCDDPLRELERTLENYKIAHLPHLPRFVGGLVGYAAYDMVRYVEELPNVPEDDLHLPDLLFGLYETMVIFDHVNKTIKVLANAHLEGDSPAEAYRRAGERIEQIVSHLSRTSTWHLADVDVDQPVRIPYKSNFRRADFEAAVEKCKKYIRAGDIFQVVISQRLEVQTDVDPFAIYRALRIVNPSPFMFYLRAPQVTLVGSSPEIMCRVEDGEITNRPLAGTRRRGRTPEEDLALEKDLLADPKERAEHIMLVDLGRNDVGRVAKLGSVRLTDVMTIERYSHVMHITSEVRGRLEDGKTCFDALRAALPVGTVSGAPKVRAMQIIDELEPTKRGPYAGAVGYVDFSGNMDTCIALRTIVITGGKAYVQAGAGIVADSVPAREYEETINKAKGMLTAIQIARELL